MELMMKSRHQKSCTPLQKKKHPGRLTAWTWSHDHCMHKSCETCNIGHWYQRFRNYVSTKSFIRSLPKEQLFGYGTAIVATLSILYLCRLYLAFQATKLDTIRLLDFLNILMGSTASHHMFSTKILGYNSTLEILQESQRESTTRVLQRLRPCLTEHVSCLLFLGAGISQDSHGTGIFTYMLHECLIFMVNYLDKYTSLMDPMGMCWLSISRPV